MVDIAVTVCGFSGVSGLMLKLEPELGLMGMGAGSGIISES